MVVVSEYLSEVKFYLMQFLHLFLLATKELNKLEVNVVLVDKLNAFENFDTLCEGARYFPDVLLTVGVVNLDLHLQLLVWVEHLLVQRYIDADQIVTFKAETLASSYHLIQAPGGIRDPFSLLLHVQISLCIILQIFKGKLVLDA